MIITGASGIVGSRLMKMFPKATGLDRAYGHELSDLHADYWESFRDQDVVVHLAAYPSPTNEEIHFSSVSIALNVIAASIRYGVPRLIFASSTWAAPRDDRPMTVYGYGKLAVEEMLKMFSLGSDRAAIAIRIGCVKLTGRPERNADPISWALYQTDEELREVFEKALAAPPGFTLIEKMAVQS